MFLFVDMLYTNATRRDPDFKTVLAALDVAHRWQVENVVQAAEQKQALSEIIPTPQILNASPKCECKVSHRIFDIRAARMLFYEGRARRVM